MDTAELKLRFDAWFYEVTIRGSLIYEYQPDILINISKSAEQLGLSRTKKSNPLIDRLTNLKCSIKEPSIICLDI